MEHMAIVDLNEGHRVVYHHSVPPGITTKFAYVQATCTPSLESWKNVDLGVIGTSNLKTALFRLLAILPNLPRFRGITNICCLDDFYENFCEKE